MTTANHHHKKEHWLNSYWRPMMGWSYLVICLFDFLVAPILWSLAQATFHGTIQTQWQPITLLGGGLYHISMGVILGVSSYGRTQEKLNGVANNNMLPPMPSIAGGTLSGAYVSPNPTTITRPSTPTDNSVNSSTAIISSSPAVSNVSGKLAPPQEIGPEL